MSPEIEEELPDSVPAIGRSAMVRLGTIADVGTLIIDSRPDGEILRLIEENGVEIVC